MLAYGVEAASYLEVKERNANVPMKLKLRFISMHETTAARWKTPNFHQCGEKEKGKAKVYLVIETSGAGT